MSFSLHLHRGMFYFIINFSFSLSSSLGGKKKRETKSQIISLDSLSVFCLFVLSAFLRLFALVVVIEQLRLKGPTGGHLV